MRTFAGAFGSAIILDHCDRKDEAREAALIALEWTTKTKGPLPSFPKIGIPPQIPADWIEKMERIAEI